MKLTLLATFASMSIVVAAETMSVAQLIELARRQPQSPAFRAELERLLGSGTGAKVSTTTAHLAEFVSVARSDMPPELLIDDAPGAPVSRVQGAPLWFAVGERSTGRAHAFQFILHGKPLGPRSDVPFFGADSYEKPGVPQGKVSEKLVHTSRIYDGMTSDYWIYVPAQYNPSTPAALMVWQDGEVYVERNASRTQNVIDNLIHEKKIPVMIQVFISPGLKGTQRMRSIEYDTVDDTYARFLRDEILVEVQGKYNLRRDGYSRGIAGESSGAICAFNVAWHQPDQFSRVLSRIGSYTSIQWKPGVIDGGNIYPFKVRKEPKRNIRVWLEDGAEDLENNHGSWPLQNIQLANSLKMSGYDFRFIWGNAQHNRNNGHAQLPQALTWLWRDYDPSNTTAQYEQEPAERDQPMFRVRVLNRN